MKYNLKPFFLALTFLGFSSLSYAVTPTSIIDNGQYPRLNTIHYQVSDEKWIVTQTAKVTVQIDASLNQKGLNDLDPQLTASLKSLANVNWQITNFSRTQDQSGLEKVEVLAESRLSPTDVVNIRAKTEALTKPGLKYQIANIEYTPTESEIQNAQATLRANLYAKVQAEVTSLNKIFAPQTFYVHKINFMPDNVAPQPMMKMNMMAVSQRDTLAAAPATQTQNTSVSQKVALTANVELASTIANP